MSYELAQHLTHIADFSKFTGVPPRLSAYLQGWRCSFGPVDEETRLPVTKSGLRVAKWRSVGFFYDKAQLPEPGDYMTDLRYYRTRMLIRESLTVVEVVPFAEVNAYIVLLTDKK